MDPAKTALARQLKHESPIVSCRFDRAAQYVFFGDQECRLWRWAWNTETKVELPGHDSWCRALATTPANDVLITGGFDGRLIWWPVATEQPQPLRQVLDAHRGWIRAAEVSPDGKLLATAGNDRLVRLWNMADGALVQELRGHESDVYNVTFHPSGQALASCDLKCHIWHWDVATGKAERQLRAASLHKYDETFKADIGGCRGLRFNADGSQLAGGGMMNVTNAFAGVGQPAVVVFDWSSGKEVIQHETKGKGNGVVWNLAFHPDHLWLAVVGGGGG
ncbi:MAG: WD40 repeat domain-containing protein, partial [Pirellulaceae bacterium]